MPCYIAITKLHGIIFQRMGIDNETEPGRGRALSWLKKSLIPLAGLVGALAIFAVIVWFYKRYPNFFNNLQNYRNRALIGYGVTFAISVLLNATIIIPVSAMAIMSSLGGVLPLPYLVGIIGGIGAAIGEMTGYVVGRSGRGLLAKNKTYLRVERWINRWGFYAVLVFSIFPILFDIVGIIAGAARMRPWRFFVATWLGRTLSYVAVAYLGRTLLSFLTHFS
jgi:membrane protein DedA with SNARE-associated domain